MLPALELPRPGHNASPQSSVIDQLEFIDAIEDAIGTNGIYLDPVQEVVDTRNLCSQDPLCLSAPSYMKDRILTASSSADRANDEQHAKLFTTSKVSNSYADLSQREHGLDTILKQERVSLNENERVCEVKPNHAKHNANEAYLLQKTKTNVTSPVASVNSQNYISYNLDNNNLREVAGIYTAVQYTAATAVTTVSDCSSSSSSSSSSEYRFTTAASATTPMSPVKKAVTAKSNISHEGDSMLAATTDTSHEVSERLKISSISEENTSQDTQVVFPANEVMPSLKAKNSKVEKKSLSTKISKSFGNFFQKVPSSPDSRSENDNPTTDTPKRGKSSSTNTQRKELKRRSSLAGKLMTSFSEWRSGNHKLHQHPGQAGVAGDETPEEKESHNNNQKKTPLFVSPEEQTEIVDDAPCQLTEAQKTCLRKSWQAIKNDVAVVGVETFMGLFHTHPDAIGSFLAFKDISVNDIEQSAVLKAHALRVMQTVDKCVSRLEEADKMANVLTQLGRRHVGYRANVNLIPIIGQQFISAIEPKIADMWDCETQSAWETLFHLINYNIRRGIMEEKHIRLNGYSLEQSNKN